MSDFSLAAPFFVQLAAVCATCRGLEWRFARLRQPLVVAETVAEGLDREP